MRSSEPLALRWSDIQAGNTHARVSKAQFKDYLTEQTKVAKIRDVLLNESAQHALATMRPHTESAGSCVFRSARYSVDFETEKPLRDILVKALKALGIRHRKTYNTRHTYATMLLMAGVNINWVASQLGNSPLVVATVYAKWINGQADKEEWQSWIRRACALNESMCAEKKTEILAQKLEMRAAENTFVCLPENEIG